VVPKVGVEPTPLAGAVFETAASAIPPLRRSTEYTIRRTITQRRYLRTAIVAVPECARLSLFTDELKKHDILVLADRGERAINGSRGTQYPGESHCMHTCMCM